MPSTKSFRIHSKDGKWFLCLMWAFITPALIPPSINSYSSTPGDSIRKSVIVEVSGENKTDNHLRKMIYDDLMNDPLVRPENLSVEVRGSEVILGGTVNDLYARWSAGRSVRCRLGVSKVINQMRVNRNPAVTDQDISGMVSAALKSDPYICEYEFKVAVSDGGVKLSGTVSSKFERNQAVNTAALVCGVVSVSENIAVAEKSLFSQENGPTGSLQEFRAIADSILGAPGSDSTLSIIINRSWLMEGYEPPHIDYHTLRNHEMGSRECFNFVGASIYLIRRFILKDSTLTK